MPDKYAKEQIKEIYDLFYSDDMYSLLVNNFYNAATKKEKNEVDNLRANILNTTSNYLKIPGRIFDVPELTMLLTSFREHATIDKTSQTIRVQERNHLIKQTRNLLKITDGFSNHTFKYNSLDSFASSQVANSPTAIKDEFKKLTGYQALAKKIIAEESNKTYSTSKKEDEAIKELVEKQGLDPTDLKKIYEGLATSYDKVSKMDFVKAAAKTNYLKNAGLHLKQILIATGITLGVTALLATSGLGGMPSADPSAEAIASFVVKNVLPWGAAGLVTAGGITAYNRLRVHGKAKKMRNQIKIKVKDKALFFDLLQTTRPTNLNKNQKQETSIEKFASLLKTRGMELNLEYTKFTEKSLTKLLNSTRSKIDSTTKIDAINKHLETFRAKLASKGIVLDNSSTSDREFLLKLLNETRNIKGKKDLIDESIKKFEDSLKANQARVFESKEFDLDLGLLKATKRKNYLHLLATEDKINGSKRNLGAPLFRTTRRNLLDRKKFNAPNITTNIEYNDKIAQNLSSKNPMCKIMGLEGTKVSTKTKKPSRTSVSEIIVTPITNVVPTLARGEEEVNSPQLVTNERSNLNEVTEVLTDPAIKEDTISYDFNGIKFEIEMQKKNIKLSSDKINTILTSLDNKIQKMAVNGIKDKPTTLSFGETEIKITKKNDKPTTRKK